VRSGGVFGGEEVFRQLDGEGFERGVGGCVQMGDELLLGPGGDAGALAGFGLAGLGLGFEAVRAAAGQFEELGAVAVVAEASEFREQFAQALPAVLGAGGAFEEGAGGNGEVGGEELGKFFGEDIAGGGMEVGGVFHELVERVALLVEVLPIEEAALFPMGEIDFVDGLAVEVVGEDGLDFREGVEPGGELLGFLAVVEALVELVADGAGEAGDFALAGR
jgi:hypothetical protein